MTPMNLEIPPDPKKVDKNWIEKWVESFGISLEKEKELSREGKKAILKQATALPSYFWTENNWKEQLEPHEISWDNFQRFCRRHYSGFLKWWEGEEDWEKAVKDFIEELKEEFI